MGRCATKMVMLGDLPEISQENVADAMGVSTRIWNPRKPWNQRITIAHHCFYWNCNSWASLTMGNILFVWTLGYRKKSCPLSRRFLCELSWWLGVPKLLKWPRHHVEQHESLGFIELLRQEASSESLWRRNPCCNGAVARWFCMSFCLKMSQETIINFLEFSDFIR